ncbi:MAG: tetratricopeptide repeat protein [Rhodospirillales bacterium]|nr:tetratricopeptide repeat protein [Rhodospirillales bacterium]
MRVLFVVAALALASCAAQSPALRSAAGARLSVADAALRGGDPSLALHVADAVLARQPTNVEALLREGDALAALGRTDEAALSYQHVLALEPGSRAARIGLGRIRLKSDPAQAERLFAEVVRAHPNDVVALDDRGIALDLEGRHQAAAVSYRAALAVQPDDTAAEVNLALSLALAGHARQAVAMLRPLAQSETANRRIQDDLAVALAMSGETQAASDVLAPELSRSQITTAIAAYRALQPGP